MSNPRHFIRLPSRRATRGGAMLLIVVWTVLWVSQAYAACCGPHSGSHQESMNPDMETHAIVQSEHNGRNDPREPCGPQMLVEEFPIPSEQPGIADDGRLVQPVLVRQGQAMLFEPHRAGNDRIPDSPGPPDRVYLRLQRFLI